MRLAEMLLEQMDSTWAASHWHAPLAQLLERTTAAQAAWRPPQGGHTIHEIVVHLDYSAREMASRCKGGPRRWDESQSWVATPEPLTEAAWRETVRSFEEHRRELAEAVAALTDEQLAAPAYHGRPLLRHLSEVIQHEAYHAGQIAYIRRMLGEEPLM
ncbi:MAG: DinB family protein [Firmicutes bacterium]|nr:DinB family protein [Bacillota bacterium]